MDQLKSRNLAYNSAHAALKTLHEAGLATSPSDFDALEAFMLKLTKDAAKMTETFNDFAKSAESKAP